MNLYHLRYFVTLAHLEHYTKAAELLSITQPSLSHAISSLEKELGVKLFEKEGRNVVLTKCGQVFLEDVQQALSILDSSVSKLQMTGSGEGQIDLAVLRTLSTQFVPGLVRDYLKEHPRQNIEFRFHNSTGLTPDMIEGLKNRKYDIAFCSKMENEPTVEFIPVAKEELVLIVPNGHPLCAREEIDLSETLPYPQIAFSRRSGLRPIIDRLFHGCGGQPEIGEKAAMESKEEIKAELENTDMVFITAGMGGGTGTGAAAVVAEIAKSCNALTVAVVTTPFAFEGKKKFELAQQGIERLRKQVDTLILIPNQYLLKVVENNTPIKQAFLIADDVLYQGVQGISELITEPGEINIDFADVKTVMKGKGDALMGIGFGEGANRAVDAAKEAISNPLLENASIDGAKSVLVNIAGSDSLTLQEYQDVVELITANCAEDALIIAGQAFNPELGDRIKVTVVATGFVNREVTGGEIESESALRRFVNTERSESSGHTAVRESIASQPARPAPAETPAPSAPKSAPTDAEAITVNRWQDLQQQLGKRSQGNDYSIPAVMRYRQGEDNEGERR